MKVYKKLLLVFLSLFISYSMFAQMVQDNSKWTFEAKKKSGDQYDLIIHLKLPEKWHIYSFKPGGDGMELPPAITFDKNSQVTLNGNVTEKGKLISEKMDGIDGIVNMFKGNVDYLQHATIKGNTKITGTYNYQICNDEMCLPPKTKSFALQVKDAGGNTDNATTTATAAPAERIDATSSTSTNMNGGTMADTSAKAIPAAPALPPASAPAPAKKENRSLLWLFLAAFGGGLAAVITPCVYSMIPITVSFFTKRSKTRAEGIKNASYYSLSIIIIFTVLGVLISAVFGSNALNSLSTNWIANLFFFIIFVIFGVSFLGAFEITLPSSWTSKTD